jgi:glycosyltransferase involved in cell wall biosynthesis
MSEVKIAAIVPYRIYPPKMGGQKGIALFYQYLSSLNPVQLFTTPDNHVEQPNDIRLHHPLRKTAIRYLDISSFFRIKKLVRREKISHLIIEHPYLGWLGILLKWSTGVRLITHSHNIEGLRFRSTGKWWWGILWNYEKLVHRNSDLNFFVTKEDLDYAVRHFKLKKEKCTVITYGIETDKTPSLTDRLRSREIILRRHGISQDQKVLLFNGTLNYKPNEAALDIIVKKVLPDLRSDSKNKFSILICGKNLPERFNQFRGMEGIIYAGFVDDIENYFLGSDIFINPVIEGGGIKTKLVEALAWGLTCISTEDGALGIPLLLTGDKLITVPNGDWKSFNQEILKAAEHKGSALPENYFNHFYWGNVAKKALDSIRNCR